MIVLLLSSSIGLIVWFIPDTNIPVLDIIQNSALVIILYIPVVLILNLSEDVTEIVINTSKKALRFFRPSN